MTTFNNMRYSCQGHFGGQPYSLRKQVCSVSGSAELVSPFLSDCLSEVDEPSLLSFLAHIQRCSDIQTSFACVMIFEMYFMYLLWVHVHEHAKVWDSLQESVLSFYHVVSMWSSTRDLRLGDKYLYRPLSSHWPSLYVMILEAKILSLPSRRTTPRSFPVFRPYC